jgi:spore coat protein CotH
MPRIGRLCRGLATLAFALSLNAVAQAPGEIPDRPQDGPPDDLGGSPPFMFDGPPPMMFGRGGGPGGFGGPGGPGGNQKAKLLEQFDKDGDHILNATERKAAREYLAKQSAGGFGPRRGGRFRFGPPGQNDEATPEPGPKLTPADVKIYSDASLYDPRVVRTFFLEFEDADWEKEMAEFRYTDIDLPATMTVDGKTYPNVGVHFRGMSSYMMVREGRKRSLNLSLDVANKHQEIGGYHTLNLLNSHEDPTFLRSILSYQIARAYVPAPKANFVRVVINGESWGIYVNVEQFNKTFVKEWFGTNKGARWKVPGSPGGQGSLAYLGDDPAAYKRIYQIKSKDEAKPWADLINLCKTLNETPVDQLEAALAPRLDIDGALKFLALQNVLINNDGYWIRTSDYDIYEEKNGRFHVLPQDSNENFLRPEGPRPGFGGRGFGGRGRFGRRGGFGERGGPEAGSRAGGNSGGAERGGPGGFPGRGKAVNGVELDPLIGADDPSKPLISKLLAVPALRGRYLEYVRQIAEQWLDWNKLGPIAEQFQALIADDVKKDTRKLASTEEFLKGITEDIPGQGFGPGGRGTISLKNFALQRREYLLNHPEVKKAAAVSQSSPSQGGL